MKIFYLLGILFTLSACSQVGSVVSHIRRTKNGDTVVEKCVIEHNALSGMISFKNCQEFVL